MFIYIKMDKQPIIPNENLIKLNEIKCFEHQNNTLVGICNDKNCKEKTKYMCIDCMFEKHSGHSGIKLNIIEDKYKEKLKNELNKINFISSEYINFEINLRHKIDNMKIKINNILENFYKNYIEKIKKENNINEYKGLNIIKDNYPPNNKEQLSKMVEELLNIYNNINNKEEEKDKDEKSYFNNYNDVIDKKLIQQKNIYKNF